MSRWCGGGGVVVATILQWRSGRSWLPSAMTAGGLICVSGILRLIEYFIAQGQAIGYPDLLIGCVDTRGARGVIDRSLCRKSSYVTYWLDLGNNASSGQFVLGQPHNGRNRRKAERLRTVSELFTEIADATTGEDPLPSCSAVEALERQEPFINQTLAASALAMLARLFGTADFAITADFLTQAPDR